MPQELNLIGTILDLNGIRTNQVHQVLEKAAISCDVQDFDETELPQALKSHPLGSIYDNKCDFCQD